MKVVIGYTKKVYYEDEMTIPADIIKAVVDEAKADRFCTPEELQKLENGDQALLRDLIMSSNIVNEWVAESLTFAEEDATISRLL